MRRFVAGSLCLGALLVSGVLATPATATASTCGSYRATDTSRFTRVRVVGVSCATAHKVLKVWADSGSGGTDLGFLCTDQSTSSNNVYTYKCTKGAQVIRGRATFTS